MEDQKPPTQTNPSTPTTATEIPSTTTSPMQTAEPHGRNWNKWILIGMMLLVVILTGSALMLSQQKNNEPQKATNPQPTVTQTSPTPDPTADWKAYTNPKWGYAFKYPPTWTVYENTNLLGTQLPQIGVGFMTNEMLQSIDWVVCNKELIDNGGCEEIPLNNEESATIFWNKQNSTSSIRLRHPQGIIFMIIKPLNANTKTSIYQILSTFKFTDKQKKRYITG